MPKNEKGRLQIFVELIVREEIADNPKKVNDEFANSSFTFSKVFFLKPKLLPHQPHHCNDDKFR